MKQKPSQDKENNIVKRAIEIGACTGSAEYFLEKECKEEDTSKNRCKEDCKCKIEGKTHSFNDGCGCPEHNGEKFTPSTAPCTCGYEEARHKTCKFCILDKFKNNRIREEWKEELERLLVRKERVLLGMCATCGSKENHDERGEFGTFTHQFDYGIEARMFNEVDWMLSKIDELLKSQLEEIKEKNKPELEKCNKYIKELEDKLKSQKESLVENGNGLKLNAPKILKVKENKKMCHDEMIGYGSGYNTAIQDYQSLIKEDTNFINLLKNK